MTSALPSEILCVIGHPRGKEVQLYLPAASSSSFLSTSKSISLDRQPFRREWLV